jgi:hypothetical protein
MKSLLANQPNPARGAGRYQKSRRTAISALSAVIALSAPILAVAGDASKATVETASTVWEKPAWLTDLSLRVGESYDTNVYLAGVAEPAGDLIALRNKSSWVTTITPKIGVDLAKFLDKDNFVKSFTLGYNPDILVFHDASDESYQSHRFTTGFKGKAENVTVTLDNAFTYINGVDNGLLYPGGASAYANGVVRERRSQWQERTKAAVKINVNESFFIRPTVSLLYYDLDTNFFKPSGAYTGYTNYIDRYDVNGGVDLGYNVNKDVAFTLGYRYGHQYQQTLPAYATSATTLGRNASNDYQRVLVGVEGSPLKWLKVEAQVGPQFTSYGDGRPYRDTVVAYGQIDENNTDIFAEASVTISPTASDALVLKYKRWNWVSSTGVNAYRDTSFDASYRHQISKNLQLAVGVRASQSDYNPSSLRNDWLYTTSVGVKYNITKNLIWDLSYAYDRGENDQLVGNAVTGANVDSSTRQFDRSIVSSGITWAF